MQTESHLTTDDLRAVIAQADQALRDGTATTVRIADLARAAGVSVRTMFRVSARHLGGPPIAQLRRSRLEQVRRQLLRADRGETVTSAATDAGFFHLGRFSALYRRHFGESPSETLRRARASLAADAGPSPRVESGDGRLDYGERLRRASGSGRLDSVAFDLTRG